MPHLAAPAASFAPPLGFYRAFGQNDEAVTSQGAEMGSRDARDEIFRSSVYWPAKAAFIDARWRLKATASLADDWDTYGAEPPTGAARALAARILDILEESLMPPSRLMASAEGGIAMSFVEGHNRAEIEIYNSGEIAVATYSGQSEPVVRDVTDTESALNDAVDQIRVRLTA